MSGTAPADTLPAAEEDPFTAAFARLSALSDTVAGSAVGDAVAPASDTIAGGEDTLPAAGDTISGGQDTLPATTEMVTGGEDTLPAAETVQGGQDDDILARLSELVKAKAPPAPAPAPAAETIQGGDPEPEIYTKEEKDFLADYAKDWPEVHKAEALMRRAEYRQIVGYVFGEVTRLVVPLMETVGTLATRTHLTDLTTEVTDYDDVRDKVVEWAGKQPKYLQDAYQHVINNGTVDEVTDLIKRWRAETGVAGAPTPAATKPARKPETELPSATKQAAAELAPVGSKRSAVSTGIDPNDFGAAFEAFAEKA